MALILYDSKTAILFSPVKTLVWRPGPVHLHPARPSGQ